MAFQIDTRPRVVRPRARAAARRGSQGAAARPHHGGDLPHAARRDRGDGCRVLDQRIVAHAAAQVLDRVEDRARGVTAARASRSSAPAGRARRRGDAGAGRVCGDAVRAGEDARRPRAPGRRRRRRARQRPAPADRRLSADAGAARDGPRRRPRRGAAPPPAADARPVRRRPPRCGRAARLAAAGAAAPRRPASSRRAACRGASARRWSATSAASPAAGFAAPPAQTVAECFAATPPRALAALWAPLCLAALNTPPERARRRRSRNVLREAFGARAGASDFLVPACDLSALLSRRRRRATSSPAAARSATGVDRARRRTPTRGRSRCAPPPAIERFAAAIVAVGPHQLAATVAGAATRRGRPRAGDPWRAALAQVAAFAYESITTAWLAYPAPVALPAPIARLDDAPGQWVFDRGDGAGGERRRGRARARCSPSSSAPAARTTGRTTPRSPRASTRSCGGCSRGCRRRCGPASSPSAARPTPARRRSRGPPPDASRPGLYLAGDYTDAELAAHARGRDAQRRRRGTGPLAVADASARPLPRSPVTARVARTASPDPATPARGADPRCAAAAASRGSSRAASRSRACRAASCPWRARCRA